MLWHLRNLLTHCRQIHYEVDKYLCEVVDQFVHIKKTCVLPFSGSALSLQNSMHVQLANRFVCMCFSCLNLQLHLLWPEGIYTTCNKRCSVHAMLPRAFCDQTSSYDTPHLVPLFPLFKLLSSIRH